MKHVFTVNFAPASLIAVPAGVRRGLSTRQGGWREKKLANYIYINCLYLTVTPNHTISEAPNPHRRGAANSDVGVAEPSNYIYISYLLKVGWAGTKARPTWVSLRKLSLLMSADDDLLQGP
jgi:hypothetical protein